TTVSAAMVPPFQVNDPVVPATDDRNLRTLPPSIFPSAISLVPAPAVSTIRSRFRVIVFVYPALTDRLLMVPPNAASTVESRSCPEPGAPLASNFTSSPGPGTSPVTTPSTAQFAAADQAALLIPAPPVH